MLYAKYEKTGSGLSSFWGNCPLARIAEDPAIATVQEGRFSSGGKITSPTTEAALVGLPLSGFGSSGATITYGSGQFGELVLTEATDNEAVHVREHSQPFQISQGKGELWFETRLKVGDVLSAAEWMGVVVGLCDSTALTVNIPLSSANPPILDGLNFVGFFAKEDDDGDVDASYIADGVAPVDVQETIHTFVAATYVKFGMHFSPLSNKLTWYVNGTAQGTQKAIPNNTGTDFPADAKLGFCAGHKMGGGGGTGITTLDWYKVVQMR